MLNRKQVELHLHARTLPVKSFGKEQTTAFFLLPETKFNQPPFTVVIYIISLCHNNHMHRNKQSAICTSDQCNNVAACYLVCLTQFRSTRLGGFVLDTITNLIVAKYHACCQETNKLRRRDVYIMVHSIPFHLVNLLATETLSCCLQ